MTAKNQKTDATQASTQAPVTPEATTTDTPQATAEAPVTDKRPTPPPLPTNPDVETVEFDSPIMRGDLEIKSVNINKPKAGVLRGLNLADLMKLEVDAIIKLTPRISTPPLAEHEVAELSPVDFMGISTAVIGFFATKEQRKVARQKAEAARASDYPSA